MTRPVNVAALASLDPEEFDRLVELNVTYTAPHSPAGQRRIELWGALAKPDLIDLTFASLGRLLRRWEDNIAARKARLDAFHQECHSVGPQGKAAWFQAKTEYELWRGTAVQTRADVVRRHGEIKSIIHSYRAADPAQTPRGERPEPNPAKHRHNTDTLFQLAYAVAKHREAYDREKILPLPEDLELWERLEQLTTLTLDGPISLDKWVEDITSKPGFQPRPGM